MSEFETEFGWGEESCETEGKRNALVDVQDATIILLSLGWLGIQFLPHLGLGTIRAVRAAILNTDNSNEHKTSNF